MPSLEVFVNELLAFSESSSKSIGVNDLLFNFLSIAKVGGLNLNCLEHDWFGSLNMGCGAQLKNDINCVLHSYVGFISQRHDLGMMFSDFLVSLNEVSQHLMLLILSTAYTVD
jgi:hypothetical protein